MTATELAEELGVRVGNLDTWQREGVLPPPTITVETRNGVRRPRRYWPLETVEMMRRRLEARGRSRVWRDEPGLTVQEFAGLHGVTVCVVHRWIRSGYYPATRTPKGYVLPPSVMLGAGERVLPAG